MPLILPPSIWLICKTVVINFLKCFSELPSAALPSQEVSCDLCSDHQRWGVLSPSEQFGYLFLVSKLLCWNIITSLKQELLCFRFSAVTAELEAENTARRLGWDRKFLLGHLCDCLLSHLEIVYLTNYFEFNARPIDNQVLSFFEELTLNLHF